MSSDMKTALEIICFLFLAALMITTIVFVGCYIGQSHCILGADKKESNPVWCK